MSDENVKIVRGVYEAAKQGDLAAGLAVLDPSFVLHEADSLPYGGSYHGPEGFAQGFGTIVQHLGPFEFELENVLGAGDEHVLVLIHIWGTAPATGKAYDMNIAELWKLRDGKAVELRPYYWDTAKLLESLG